jgi:hypothetical protein
VVETLVSQPVNWINFTFAGRMISPIGYRYIASMVSNGKITCEVNSSLNNTAMYDPNKNKIIASDQSYGETYFDEKALLVHESTHAILDMFYNGRDMNGGKSGGITVLQDETIAYLAQAMYIVAAKGATPSDKTIPDYYAYDVVKSRLEAIMKNGWTGCDTINFTNADVAKLQTSIKNNDLYKSNYTAIALHNG